MIKPHWIKTLEMTPHPEGGYYKEIYRSQDIIQTTGLPQRYSSPRNTSTSIYFLLTGDNFSAFHRLKSDEIWHFYTGSSLTIYVIAEDGTYTAQKLGSDYENGEIFQFVVPANHWFASRCNDPEGFSLVGCMVAPGFDFADFEMAERESLIKAFPQHGEIISELTR